METFILQELLNGERKPDEEVKEYLSSLVEKYPYFQLAWMLYLKTLKDLGDPEYDRVLKVVAVRVPDRQQLYKFLHSELTLSGKFELDSVMPAYNLDEPNIEPSGDSLIDRFLADGPGRITNQEKGFDKASTEYLKKIADQSVAENEEIVTEALAVIYFEQKNYEKAQKAYQKLSLKYPEKSVYFATRIKEIEKLKNL